MTEHAIASSGNVFDDLGVSNAPAHLLKARLVGKLAELMEKKRLTQMETARLTGLSQPDVSRMLRGQFRDISVERIIRALTRLGADVDIEVSSKGKPVGETIRLSAVVA